MDKKLISEYFRYFQTEVTVSAGHQDVPDSADSVARRLSKNSKF
jgi:hypothetical protein